MKSWLELAIEQIHNDWFVSFQKTLPVLFWHNFIVSSVRVFRLNIRFLLDSVQIFVNCVNQIRKELIWILLSISSELFGHFPNGALYIVRRNPTWSRNPHILHQFSIRFRNSPFRPHWIESIDFLDMQIEQKVFCQRFGIAETLKSGIHKTSISQIR